jgi:hypothetical protein
MEQKDKKYGSSKFSKYIDIHLDNLYVIGREITKATDKIIPGKRERRDYALRTRVSQLLDGELPDEELTKLGFQGGLVKGNYISTLGFTAVGIFLDSLFFVLAGTTGALGVLHQLAMSKKIKNKIEKMTEEERKKLKEYLKDKDTYQFREVLHKELGF